MVHVVFQTAFIGDILLAGPLLKQIRHYYPEDQILLVCRKGVGELMRSTGLADEVHEVDKSRSSSWRKLRRELAGRQFGFVFCPHQSWRSAMFVRKMKAAQKIGFKKWWNSWIFDICVDRPMLLPDALRQLSLLAAVNERFDNKFKSSVGPVPSMPAKFLNPMERGLTKNWKSPIPQWASMHTKPSLDAVDAVCKKFDIRGRPVLIAPGSVWATKKWTASGFAGVAAAYSGKAHSEGRVLLIGSEAERKTCEEIHALVPECVNLAGQTTLIELHALMSISRLVVSNDSSPAHLAAMAGAPVVTLFGPTTLELGYAPWSNRAATAQIDIGCRPCGKHGHKKCPIGTHQCMRDLDSGKVLELAQELVRG